ncbi:hypothetical protein [Halosolutus gelatinilyticus]|uniref:hypothetical protein n=1 Tax=Halosolutus gelatinilyticus TaxID=2931975 RepID=UPI001FF1BFF0|nr:hypothetical protein [Halosolutus gelatinilyticus]
MDSRLLASGVGTTGLGVAVLLGLAANGVVRQPASASEQTMPAEFLAIGIGFLLVVVGVLATFLAYVEPSMNG